MLEGRVAELVRWGTEASEGYLHLRERERRGHPSLEPRAKVRLLSARSEGGLRLILLHF